MIKAIMMVIRAVITQDVTALPLKRNLVLRFSWGGGAQETMKNNSMMDGNRVHLVGSE
jgi:hypothetical protein